jgi:sugar phosphate isomerase/epimerase
MNINKKASQSPRLNPDSVLELGIFAKTFQRASIEEVFDAIADNGLTVTQWNWSCVPGFSSLPETVPVPVTRAIARAATRADVRICAVSATFNIIQPAALEAALSRLPALARAARAINCDLLTLCTGTRHPTDMWAYHPNNRSRESWERMVNALRQVIHAVKPYEVRLAIEPESANVVCDARSAELALRELGADGECVSIILDAANLYRPPVDPRMNCHIIDDAVQRLGEHISLAHAKDIADPGIATPFNPAPDHFSHVAAGSGILAYDRYVADLTRTAAAQAVINTGRRLPLLLHGLTEQEVPGSVAFLRNEINACDSIWVEPSNALLSEP